MYLLSIIIYLVWCVIAVVSFMPIMLAVISANGPYAQKDLRVFQFVAIFFLASILVVEIIGWWFIYQGNYTFACWLGSVPLAIILVYSPFFIYGITK